MFYQKILPYNPIGGSYIKIQHVIIMDMDLVQYYLYITLDYTKLDQDKAKATCVEHH